MGGGAKAVANALGCSMKEAQVFVNAYAEGFKGIAKFKKIGSDFVRSHGYVVMCKHTGHKMYWEDWKKWRAIEDMPEELRKLELTSDELREHNMAGAKWDRMALNSVTQGTGACIIKLAAILYFDWICKNNYFGKVLLCDLVHDEIVSEFPKELSSVIEVKLPELMEKASAALCKKLPIPAEGAVGTYWIH